MNRIGAEWRRRYPLPRWVAVGAVASGGGSLTLLAVRVALGAPAARWDTALIAGVSLYALLAGVRGLRDRWVHRVAIRTARSFRKVVRRLAYSPAYYVNEVAGVVFVHHGYRLLGVPVADFLMRVSVEDTGRLYCDLDLEGRAVSTYEVFQMMAGGGSVWRWSEGLNLRRSDDGSVERDVTPTLSHWRQARGRFLASRQGLLDATEAELREVCDQLAHVHLVGSLKEGRQ